LARLIGEAIETDTDIYFGFTDKDLSKFGGAHTISKNLEEYNRLKIEINPAQVAKATVPTYYPVGKTPADLFATIFHEFGHAYGFFELGAKHQHRLRGEPGPTDGPAVQFENIYRDIVNLPPCSEHG
jgi:hypothetical protein